ncbi:MAG TPA: EAL domain-containing protein [Solirubrobacteraceae bacterium]
MPVVVALVVTVVALWLVVGWQQRSEHTRVEQIALAQLHSRANHVSTLEWQAIAEGKVSSEVSEGMRSTFAHMDAALAEFRRTDHHDALVTGTVPAVVDRYKRAIAREFSLLAAGEYSEAREYDEAVVDPTFERLSDALMTANDSHARQGDVARRRATVGSALTGSLALLLAGLLIARFLRSRKRLIALRAEEQGVRRSEREFRALAQNASDLVTVVDRDLTVGYQSDSAERILGCAPATVMGRPLADLVHPADLPRLTSLLPADTTSLADVHGRFECRMQHCDGRWVAMETLVAPMVSDTGEDRLVLTSRDIGERKALEEQLRHQAFHDALTGLPNRALFEDRVSHALAAARRSSTPVTVLLADLDDFKLVNDTLGHAAGDDLLRVVGQRLRGCLREADTAARLGGDEFAVLLEDAADPRTAEALALRIQSAVGAPIQIVDRQISPRVSLGIATSGSDAREADVLIRNADVAMYAAKRRGQSGTAVFDPSMHASTVRRFELIDELDQALADGQFVLHYQPIVELETEEIAGVEALLRWNHPRDGMVAPFEFIPLAEQTGAIVPIGRWVLREACRQAGEWQRTHGTDGPRYVCVNLSTRQLADPNLVADVRSALDAAGLRPEQLVLELTESLLIEDVERTCERMEELKAIGVRLAVDDFGTGYSALSYLQRFPLDILKIDKSFIDGLRHGTDQSNIVRALIALGSSLHLDIVAEGIEEPEQLAELRAMRSGFGQGYLFARPLAADALTALLDADIVPGLTFVRRSG